MKSGQMFSGFSLVEVIISTALVATTLGALFAIASMTIRLTALGQDRLIASQLAREGLEVSRQIRDTNFVSGACDTSRTCENWWSGLGERFPSKAGLYMIVKDQKFGFRLEQLFSDPTNPSACNGEVIERVTSSTTTQIFCRRIFLEPVGDLTNETKNVDESKDTLRVRSQVAWLGFGRKGFRHLTSDLPDQNSCVSPVTSTEWCIDYVTLLTNWRPAL